jgi:hypothetical protein
VEVLPYWPYKRKLTILTLDSLPQSKKMKEKRHNAAKHLNMHRRHTIYKDENFLFGPALVRIPDSTTFRV